jgi:hypothetical protein
MAGRNVDLSAFDTLEVMVTELRERGLYEVVHDPLAAIAAEVGAALACMEQLDVLINKIESQELRSTLAAWWHTEPQQQALALESGYDQLCTVVTLILPQQALALLRNHLH